MPAEPSPDARHHLPLHDDAPARLQAALERLVARPKIPHVVAGVRRGTDFTWSGAAGEADAAGTPMTTDTPWFVASITKLYIAAAVLRLVEEGAVDLDAPMLDYLDSERVGGVHRLDGTDHTPDITVRHLLGHTSGLPDFLEDAPRGGRSIYDALMDGQDRSWDFDEVVRILREDLQPHFAPRDLTAPRVRARYSDSGFQILIALVEAVTGRPIDQVWADRIFGPLGMTSTYLPGGSLAPAGGTVPVAGLWAEGRPLEIPQALGCFNDLVSTIDDQLVFLDALVAGRVIAPGSVAQMGERWNRIFFPMRYGLGMMRYPIGRLFAPGRRPMAFVGHSGATGTWAFHSPELDLTLVGSLDEADARAVPFRFFPRLMRALYA